MISVTCSNLEAVRNNPAAYGQLLASNDGKKSGGNHGMVACVQDVARLVHTGELTITEGVKALLDKFTRFDDTPVNKERQKKLATQFVRYCEQVKKQKLQFVDGSHKLNWVMLPDAKLTGNTPWVFKNSDGFYSYLLSESTYDWQQQLRFPIFQKYISENTMHTETDKMQVGIYSLSDNKFLLKSFTASELDAAVEVTFSVLEEVYTAYSNKKNKK